MRRSVGPLVIGAAVVCAMVLWRYAGPRPDTDVGSRPKPPGGSDESAVRVRVVNLEGRPLAGMIPIATETPNAFDAPVSEGRPTGEDGRSRLALDPSRWLYVRAWDPALRFFANNYFDIPPGPSPVQDELEIVMVEGAVLRVQLLAWDGRPAADENVGLMMFHPDKGPWWPGETDTDKEGNAVFARVPAGKFLLTMKALYSGRIELPAVYLPPGGEVNLGTVQLLPE